MVVVELDRLCFCTIGISISAIGDDAGAWVVGESVRNRAGDAIFGGVRTGVVFIRVWSKCCCGGSVLRMDRAYMFGGAAREDREN